MWGRNKKTGSGEERRETSSKASYAITGKTEKGAGVLYMEKYTEKKDEML